MEFRDHFSGHAAQYAEHRPSYPPELYAWLAEAAPDRDRVWDCGTGNGQAAVGLAEHFQQVVATDASAAQVQKAIAHPRVRYSVAGEGDSRLRDASVALVTAAQAFHWFDAPTFFREARRVLRARGVLAIWCYGLHQLGADLDPVIAHFYRDVVGADWPPERVLVESGYRNVEFPFDEVSAPQFTMERQLDLPGLLRYIETWSAVQRHRKRTGHDPLPSLEADLREPWGDPRRLWRVAWPIAMRVGRVG